MGARRGVHRPPSTYIYNLRREVRSERSREPVVSRSPTPIEALDGHILHLGLISICVRNKKRVQQCHHCFTVSHTGTPPNSFAWRSYTKLGPRASTCPQTQKNTPYHQCRYQQHPIGSLAELSVNVKAIGDTRAESINKIKAREGAVQLQTLATQTQPDAKQSTRARSPHGTRASFFTRDVFTQDDR